MYPKQLTSIHQIEITSRCNLRCKYCPQPKLERPKADISMDTYLRALEWAKYYYKKGTQPELSLTGMGEALMHPNIIEFFRLAREALPKCMLLFSTNGILFTEEVAEELGYLRISTYISVHRPEKAAPAVVLAKKYGILGDINMGFVDRALDWAGQIDWPVSAPTTLICDYLRNGNGVVLQNGDMVSCCMDAHGIKKVGHIDDEIGSVYVQPFELCDKCNMVVPEEKISADT